MKLLQITAVIALSMLGWSNVASADPWKDESGHGRRGGYGRFEEHHGRGHGYGRERHYRGGYGRPRGYGYYEERRGYGRGGY